LIVFIRSIIQGAAKAIQARAGLGLSIARNIAELLQGSLKLQHIDDIFSFQMTLPLNISSK